MANKKSRNFYDKVPTFCFYKSKSTLQNVVHDGKDVLGLFRRQFLEFFHQFFGDAGVFQLLVKKFLWMDAKIFANIEKSHHRGKHSLVFNAVDIVFTLSNRKAHVPRGNIFLATKFGKPFVKIFFVIFRIHFSSPIFHYRVSAKMRY